MSKLNKDEQEILDAFNAGSLQRAPEFKDRKTRHQQYAEANQGQARESHDPESLRNQKQ